MLCKPKTARLTDWLPNQPDSPLMVQVGISQQSRHEQPSDQTQCATFGWRHDQARDLPPASPVLSQPSSLSFFLSAERELNLGLLIGSARF